MKRFCLYRLELCSHQNVLTIISPDLVDRCSEGLDVFRCFIIHFKRIGAGTYTATPQCEKVTIVIHHGVKDT